MANDNPQAEITDDLLFEEEIYQEWIAPAPEPQYPLLTKISAELFGAMLLTFLSFGLVIFPSIVQINDMFLYVLGYSVAVIAAMAAVARVSGGHFNPAVTLGAATAGRLKWSLVLPYIGAQILGALVGSGLIFLLISSIPSIGQDVRGVFNTFVAGWGELGSIVGASLLTAALVEVILVAILVGTFLAVTSKRAKSSAAPLIMGGVIATLFVFAMPFTNSRVNPALATAGAAFADGDGLSQLWLFWVAALFGGLLAGLIYTAFSADTLSEAQALTEEDFLVEGDVDADYSEFLSDYEEDSSENLSDDDEDDEDRNLTK